MSASAANTGELFGTGGVDGGPVVLFFTDNGRGLGHVTRMLAVSRHAHGRFRSAFLTMSLGYQVLRSLGVPAEFYPAYHQLGLTKQEWSPLLAERIAEAISATEARAVVVDHVTPPEVFRDLRKQLSGVELIWSRRGLWRPGTNRGAFGLATAFDQVVEPGDLAAPIDTGPSVSNRAGIRSVGPIVLVQPPEIISREDARRALGLPTVGRALLLNLSAPDTASLVSLLERARDLIRQSADAEPIYLFAPLHPLHDETLMSVEGVTFAPVYPIARYFEAFDGAVSTAGYNSFHELVASGLPVIFLAHAQTNVDDQQRRARFAQLSGRGYWAESIDDPAFTSAIRRLLRPEEPAIASEISGILGKMEGAAEFADLIAETVDRTATKPLRLPALRLGEAERRVQSAKISAEEKGGVLLIVAHHHSTEDLARLTAEVDSARRSGLRSTPIFIIGDASPRPLVARSFAFESILSVGEWLSLDPALDYERYVAGRIEAANSRYGADRWVMPRPGDSLASALERAGSDAAMPLTLGRDSVRGRRSFRLALPTRKEANRPFLHIDLPSHLYVPRLLETSGLAGYELSTLACWLTIISLDAPGAVFDIGANVGPYAWLAAGLSDRQVTAFEPVPELAAAVRRVAEENDLHIRVEKVALADRSGSARLYLSDQTDSSNSLLEGFRPSSKSIEVDLRTVDSYVARSGTVPHAMKVDTETTEPEVLAGARATLSSHRPWLLIEVLARRSEDRLMAALDGLDYYWYRIDDDPPFERESSVVGDPNHEYLNWLFAPKPPDRGFWAEVRLWQEALRSCVPRSY